MFFCVIPNRNRRVTFSIYFTIIINFRWSH
uniref:Uncharacterized protein n=1 Tax=Heterorhabditis bacteriophora TaxID=37862 RepID=A0A1I7WLT8_HETBA